MRAPSLLIVCAALSALSARTHADTSPHQHLYQHIRTQILAKLGLSSRPMALHAPPRDVVRQILQRAAGPPAPTDHLEQTGHREIIVIAHRARGSSQSRSQLSSREEETAVRCIVSFEMALRDSHED